MRRAAPGAHKRISLLRALTWFAISYGLAVLGYVAANAIAGRWLSTEAFGYFVVVVTLSSVIGQLGLMGTHRAGLREAARVGQGEDDDELWRVLRRDARVASRVTLPFAAVVSTGVAFWLLDGSVAARAMMAAGFGLLVIFGGLQKLYANYLRGLGYIRFASLLEGRSGGALVSIAQAAALATAWYLVPESGITGAVVALAIGFSVPVAVAGLLASRGWRQLREHRSMWRQVGESISRNWRFAANQLAVYLAGSMEIWMAAVLLSAADTSDFSAAQRMSLLLAIPMTSIQVVFSPVAARMLAKGDPRGLQRILRTGATVALIIISVLWLPMVIAPGPILALVFGEPFRSAAPLLILLTFATIVNAVVGLCGTALTMSHYEGVVAGVQMASVVARLVIGTAAALAYGVVGLAVSSAAITIVTYVVLWWQAHRKLGLWTHVTLRPSLGVLRRTGS